MKNQKRNHKKPFVVLLSLMLLLSACGSQTTQESAESSKQISELTAQVSSISAENQELQEKITTYQEEVKKINEENASIKQSLTEANSKIQELSQLENQQEEIERLKAQIEELTTKNANKDAEIEKLQSEIANYQASQAVTSTSDNTNDKKSVAESNTTPEQEVTNNSYTVYITKTGSKYHSAGCRYLKQSQISIDKSDAEAQGYGACSVCNP